MTKRKHVVLLFTVFFVFLCAPFMTSNAKEEKEIVIGYALTPFIANTSVGGKGTADVRELFQIAADEFKKLHGYTVTLKIFPSPKFLFKAFDEKTVDFAGMSVATFLSAKGQNISVKPLFSYNITGKMSEGYCIFVNKDSGIKSLKDIEGKRFVTDIPIFLGKKDTLPPSEAYIYWVMTKKILSKNGINKPFKNLFKEFRVLPVPVESVVYSVMLQRFDVFLSAMGTLQTLKNYDKAFNDIKPLSCMEVPVGAALVYRADVSPDIVTKFKNHFLSPPEGSALQKILKKEFKGIKFFSVEDKDYAVYFQWLKEAEQKGWIAEFNQIMKEMMEAARKKKEMKKPF